MKIDVAKYYTGVTDSEQYLATLLTFYISI